MNGVLARNVWYVIKSFQDMMESFEFAFHRVLYVSLSQTEDLVGSTSDV